MIKIWQMYNVHVNSHVCILFLVPMSFHSHSNMPHLNYISILSFCCRCIFLLNQLLKINYFTTFKANTIENSVLRLNRGFGFDPKVLYKYNHNEYEKVFRIWPVLTSLTFDLNQFQNHKCAAKWGCTFQVFSLTISNPWFIDPSNAAKTYCFQLSLTSCKQQNILRLHSIPFCPSQILKSVENMLLWATEVLRLSTVF